MLTSRRRRSVAPHSQRAAPRTEAGGVRVLAVVSVDPAGLVSVHAVALTTWTDEMQRWHTTAVKK